MPGVAKQQIAQAKEWDFLSYLLDGKAERG